MTKTTAYEMLLHAVSSPEHSFLIVAYSIVFIMSLIFKLETITASLKKNLRENVFKPNYSFIQTFLKLIFF